MDQQIFKIASKLGGSENTAERNIACRLILAFHFRRLLNEEAARQKAIYDTPSDILHEIQAAG